LALTRRGTNREACYPVHCCCSGFFGPLSESQALIGPVQPVSEIKAAFEQELFELSHAVFLANGNLKEALAVAQRAVKARPADKTWRKRQPRHQNGQAGQTLLLNSGSILLSEVTLRAGSLHCVCPVRCRNSR